MSHEQFLSEIADQGYKIIPGLSIESKMTGVELPGLKVLFYQIENTETGNSIGLIFVEQPNEIRSLRSQIFIPGLIDGPEDLIKYLKEKID